jgi:hypothetical protein
MYAVTRSLALIVATVVIVIALQRTGREVRRAARNR